MNRCRILSVTLLLAFVLCLPLLFGASVHAEDILIGTSAAFKGPSRGLGIELYRGAMAYLEHVNQAGGVRGRRIVVRTYDDGYNPVPAIENTVRLIQEDHVFLLFGYVGTPTVTRSLPLLKKYENQQVYLFFPFTGAQPQRQPPYDQFAFNLRASYQQETEGLVDHLVAVGRPRIAVFYQIDAYGRSGWVGVRDALKKRGLAITAEATYRRGTQFSESLEIQVRVLKEAHPDAIVSIGAYGACAAFIRDARDAGLDVPIANVSFVGSESLLRLLQTIGRANGNDYTTGLINSQVVPSYEDTSLPAVRQYRDLMDRYDPEPPAGLLTEAYEPLRYSFVSFEGFLNAKLLVEILGRMEIPRKEDIRKTMEGIRDYDLGIGAPVRFAQGKNQGLDTIYYTTVKQGRFVPVKEWEAWRK
jgi:branched-chain amino acid transport system substrate-binding protein